MPIGGLIDGAIRAGFTECSGLVAEGDTIDYREGSEGPAAGKLVGQKSDLSARGTSASFPEYHWMFSAQASSSQSAGPLPPLL